MRFISVFFLSLLFLSLHIPLNASELTLTSKPEKAKLEHLSKHPQWLGLLHYNQGGTIHNRNRSYVRSSSFFLSKNGRKDPRAELEKNIELFFSKDESDIQFRCQFPARFQWLSEKLGFPTDKNGLEHCQQFIKMFDQVSAKKIVLVFPSSYMNSASSIFGHTLFRIDNTKQDQTVILNWAINYGAKLNPDDGALKYAAKGLSGKYSGQYFVVPYAQKIKEYGQMENRDIWEFSLALSQKEIDFMIAHLWELQNVEFDYYFLDENCSYRLLELLDVIRPELQLSHDFRFTEIPMNTVKILNEKNLIENQIFRPSKERLLKQKLSSLTKDELNLARQFANIKIQITNTANSDLFKNANFEKQEAILLTAYEYLRFTQTQKTREKLIAKRSLELLQLINQTSQRYTEVNTKPAKQEIPQEARVLDSHNSQRIAIAAGKYIGEDTFTKLEYRMAYHDLIDNAVGYLSGAHIEGPGIEVINQAGKTEINKFTLAEVISLNPINFLRKEFSWQIAINGERYENGQKNMSSQIKAGGGFTLGNESIIHYQLLSPLLEHNPKFTDNLKSGINYEAGILIKPIKHSSWLKFEAEKIDGFEIRFKSSFSQQIELETNHALRFQAKLFKQNSNTLFDKQKEYSLSYLYYF